MRLNRKKIIDTALSLTNKIGLDALTTRRLGEELGVEGPALYRHFRSKSELLDHMAAAILLPVLTPMKPGESWDQWLMALGRRSVDAVRTYRDGARIVAQSLPIEPLDLISGPLRDAGFRPTEARFASKLFTRFMVGWLLHEEMERSRTDRHEPTYDHNQALRFALGCLVDGLRAKVEGRD